MVVAAERNHGVADLRLEICEVALDGLFSSGAIAAILVTIAASNDSACNDSGGGNWQ